ncbi:MAG: hypothetical protein HGB17_05090 [Syntrophobacteraceae bacterium]|nr:hypothetical protein [Syntrophobacteraceae bacterium]
MGKGKRAATSGFLQRGLNFRRNRLTNSMTAAAGVTRRPGKILDAESILNPAETTSTWMVQ